MTSPTTDRRQGLVGNTPMKAPVDLATTANVTLSGEQTIDGVVTSGSRVLVKNQTDATQNGIYDTNTAAWTRSADSNGNYDLAPGTILAIVGGTTNGNTFYQVSATKPITIGSSILNFIQALFSSSAILSFIASGLGAVVQSLQDKARRRLDGADFGVVADWNIGSQTGTDNSAALAYLITQIPPNGKARLPKGIIGHSLKTSWANGSIFCGSGKNANGTTGTVLYYTGTTDHANETLNTINSFTAANIEFRDMLMANRQVVVGKGTLHDQGSSYLHLRKVGIGCSDFGLILDQTELFTAENCDFNAGVGVTAGVWCVNGNDVNGSASANFTNNLTFKDCNFGGVGTVGLAIDGGISFAVTGGQFTGWGTQIRATACRNVKISGVEMEGATISAIKFAATRLKGGTGAPTRAGIVENCFMIGGQAGSYLIDYDVAGANFTKLDHNNFQVLVAGAQPINIANTSVVIAEGNSSIDNASGTLILPATWSGLGFSSAGYVAYNNVNITSESGTAPTWTPVLTGTVTNPVIGNGNILKWLFREGPNVGVGGQIVIGSTTTLGSGGWMVNLPYAESYGTPVNGTCVVNHSGTLYTGSCYLPAGSSTLQFNGPSGALTGASPVALGTGDTITFGMTLPTRAK